MNLPKILAQFAREHEPMRLHTTFKTGGNADVYIKPPSEYFIECAKTCMQFACSHNIPLFILGGGANLCVSDKGIRGIVLDTTGFSGLAVEESGGANAVIKAQTGASADETAAFAAQNGLRGLEFLSGLPGTAGGAVYMNARCFEKQISDVLIEVEYLDRRLETLTLHKNIHEWDYKKSPFQNTHSLILSARFTVQYGNKNDIYNLGAYYKKQREEKGHYRFPSAGSVFVNNHAFGKPSGVIIDELGLRGKSIGGAQVAPWHGNFIINTGNASSADIYALVKYIKNEAQKQAGIKLVEEIIFAGEW
ncbi:MAG: UDP-N-acetylmuramate dehydrogenase [Spirochaetaceae bacterium]|jgi:UDP-N-acetylmuramate dehydrogenase|nr:UDP-N-acetylmuramate dehydrogenase [Spirochaetaceae bacterium]